MHSPFKFLDAYTLQDKELFFGRDEEVAALYQMVNKNRLILVYGQSGTGKTSLIQCGLAGRFDVTDWYPLFVRRGENINEQLRESLTQVLGDFYENHVETIDEIYANFLRPVYLIFDQLEELFILGDKEEQEAFIQTIKAILDANLPCRILFVLREEYLAHLYGFERVIPTLFDRRLRVEPMNYTNVASVITNSCQQFNIRLENEEVNIDQIIKNISPGKQAIQLPYLQVYLDRLYREDLVRSYPDLAKENALPDPLPQLEFTTAEINELGTIEGVLDEFLVQQETKIQTALTTIPEGAVKRVLDSFVTNEGTKLPLAESRVHVPGLDNAQLLQILEELELVRVIHRENDTYELAHDTLAAVIAGRRSAEDKTFREIIDLIRRRHQDYARGIGALLNQSQVQLVENFKEKIQQQRLLEAGELAYVAKSRRVIRRNRLFGAIAILMGFALLIIAILVFQSQSVKYEQRYQEATLARYRSFISQGISETNRLNFEEAILFFDSAVVVAEAYRADTEMPIALRARDPDASELSRATREKLNREPEFNRLMSQAESLIANGQLDSLLAAREVLDRAMVLDIDNASVSSQQAILDRDLNTQFRDLLRSGNGYINIGNQNALRAAVQVFEQALLIKDDPEIREKIRQCKQRLGN